jgi:hypothetical protein
MLTKGDTRSPLLIGAVWSFSESHNRFALLSKMLIKKDLFDNLQICCAENMAIVLYILEM